MGSSRATFLDSCLFFLSLIGNEKPGIFQKLTPRRPVNRKSGISRQREELGSSFKAHFVGLVAGIIFGFVSFFPISHRKREKGRKKKRKKSWSHFVGLVEGNIFGFVSFFPYLASETRYKAFSRN